MDRISWDEQREALFDAPCWVIDFLPRQVSREMGRRYFSAERYYLEHPRIDGLFRRFSELVLKLSLYYDCLVNRHPEDSWAEAPDPRELALMIEACAAGEGKGTICLLFPSENALLTADGGDLWMSLYNPPPDMLETVRQLAASEGLFVRRAAE